MTTKEIGTRVITMSNSTPVQIVTADWKPKYVILDSNGSHKHLSLRIHLDGKRAIVSAVLKDSGERYAKHAAGVQCGVDYINETIIDVADEMADKTSDDTWFDLADKLIARRDPVKI